MRDAFDGAIFPSQVAAEFVGTLSGLGMALALVGLYGSVSYSVRRRVREMGIRGGHQVQNSAHGAARWHHSRARRDHRGIGRGRGLDSAGRRSAAAGVNPRNPIMFAVVGAFVPFTGTLEMLSPPRLAATVDPSVALRDEQRSSSRDTHP
jgi:putative ABC transport system permease protein